MNDWPPALAITYLIYCIFLVSLTLGGCGYAVFVLGAHGAWFILAAILASMGYDPHRWYELYTGVESQSPSKEKPS